ncbi:porin [Paraburkholderia acidiphila]|uniref:porin n=1 Tax=Paraburkholderia acidiphila TaxID=2571747 RepID=UPI001E50D6D0|nr:porin [Paraburkholderia acidiphila]
MKKIVVSLLVFFGLQCSSFAQTSVTLYGIISVGVGWVNNEGGASNYKMLSGANQNTRFGFKIVEDLGGGNRAISQLENGFDITSGKLQQGGRLFGRLAYVGLSNDDFGTVTLGRQYDMFWDYFTPLVAASATNGLAAHPGDADNLMGSWRYSNSVKYVSPTVKGITAEALYAFSNAADAFSVNRAFSAGIGYENGPLKIAAAYVQLDRPGLVNASGAVSDDYASAPFFLFRTSPLNKTVGVDRQRNFGVGGRYDFADLRWNVLVDRVQFSYLDGTTLHLTNYDTSLSYRISPALVIGAAYIYTQGKYGGSLSASSHWNTGQISVDYLLSKRTDICLFDSIQWATGQYAVADIYGNSPSTSRNQNVLMGSIRHKF